MFIDLYNQYQKTHNLFKVIYSIIETFGPIHIDVILRKLTKFLNTQKVTSKTMKEFESELEYNPDTVLFEQNGYYSIENDFNVHFRYADELSDIRELKYINEDEIKNAMLVVIRYKGGISKDNLYRVIAKLVNNNLNNSSIVYLDNIFNNLVNSNVIELDKNTNKYRLY